MTRRLLPIAAALLAFAACADAPEPAPLAEAADVPDGEVAVPAGPGASAPRLARDVDGMPVLSWTQPDSLPRPGGGDGHSLQVARWTGAGWGEPETADTGTGRFINWADTPGAVPLADGRMLAHVLTDGPSAHTYDAQLRFFEDGAWDDLRLLNTDGRPAEHGFVSAVALADGAAGVVWLDGRNTGAHSGHHSGDMTLRYAEFDADGARHAETEIDARTCDCCPTALAATASGLVVAYRDRSAGEVRDVAVARRVDGAWTEPTIPHADGWRIDGCPVNGPALASQGDRVALAWYTEAGSARVLASVSDDGGATWGEPVRVDDGDPVGRVGVAMLGDGRVVVTWLERAGDDALVQIRALDGAASPPAPPTGRTVATVAGGRASGIPHVVALGEKALVAWTDPEAGTVRTAVVSL